MPKIELIWNKSNFKPKNAQIVQESIMPLLLQAFHLDFTYSIESFNEHPVLASNHLCDFADLSFVFSREKHHLEQIKNSKP